MCCSLLFSFALNKTKSHFVLYVVCQTTSLSAEQRWVITPSHQGELYHRPCQLPTYCLPSHLSHDLSLQGFDHHVKHDHNMWTYIYFSIYLDTIDISDHNAIEKYVYEMVRPLFYISGIVIVWKYLYTDWWGKNRVVSSASGTVPGDGGWWNSTTAWCSEGHGHLCPREVQGRGKIHPWNIGIHSLVFGYEWDVIRSYGGSLVVLCRSMRRCCVPRDRNRRSGKNRSWREGVAYLQQLPPLLTSHLHCTS